MGDIRRGGRGNPTAITGVQNVTPSDSADLTSADGFYPDAIYLDEAGTVVLRDLAGNDISYSGLVAGVWHYIQFKRVLNTGTDAKYDSGGAAENGVKAGWTT